MTASDDGLPAPDETPFKIEAAEDLLGLPDPDWLVNGVIQRNTLGLIYGPSGCGKSFLALDPHIIWRFSAHGSAMRWTSVQGCYTSPPKRAAESSSA